MFTGTYNHNIDAKGRLTIPANFREQCPEGLIITFGFDGNLLVYHKPDFSTIVDNLNQISITDNEGQNLKRHILGNTVEVDFDSAGRVLIPSFLRDLATLTSDATIVGVGDIYEIWASDLWATMAKQNRDAQVNSNRWAAYKISTRGQS